MVDEGNLAQYSERLAASLRAKRDSFEGHRVRVDAGDPGLVYVALRDARGRREVAKQFAAVVESDVSAWLEAQEPSVADFGLAYGAGDRDVVLRIELHAK